MNEQRTPITGDIIHKIKSLPGYDYRTGEGLLALMDFYGVDSTSDISQEEAIAWLKSQENKE